MTASPARRPSAVAVLILSGGGFQGLGIARALGGVPDVRIVLADNGAQPLTGLLADDVVRLPDLADVEAFMRALRETCRRLEVRLIMPATEHELAILAGASPRLERELGLKVAVSAPGVFERFGDRAALLDELGRLAVPRPPTVSLASAGEADLPLLGRPRRSSWGGRSHVVVRTADELAAARRDDRGDRLWTPFYEEFDELSLDFAIGFDGELSPVVVRERVRTSGGFCVVAAGRDGGEVEEYARRVAAELARTGGRGLFNLQFLLTSEGPLASDLNLRFGTSGVFPLGVGANFMQFLLDSATGRSPAARPATGRGVRMYRPLVERFLPDDSLALDGLVFDLDDTLLDQKAWIVGKLELLWQAMADELPPLEIFRRAGWEAIENGEQAVTLDSMISRLGLSTELRERMIDTYRAAAPKSAPLYADVRGALAALRARGLKLALVTDNPPESQRQKLEAAGITSALDCVVFTREMGAEKPDPAGVRHAAEILAIPPARLGLVGDHPLRDGEAALAADLGRFFWIERPGSFASVSPTLVRDLRPELWAVTVRIRDLRELQEAVRPR